MIKFIYSLTVASMIVITVGCSTNKLSETEVGGLPVYDLQNRYLRLTIIPQSNGRISALDYRPDNLPLFQTYSEKHESAKRSWCK
ncbi:MAG: hypothetical protein L3J71_18080 [Victivallaceae bacterium]|nr:hypothetical protein [Victivallaceae bacterium]